METGDLQHALQVQRFDQRVGLVEEVVVVEEVAEHLRVHQQRGVDLVGGRVAQQHQFLAELRQQRLGRAGIAEHEAHLLLGKHRLGERAQVEADHRALEPAAGGRDGSSSGFALQSPRRSLALRQSRKLSNCSGSANSVARSNAIAACRSSRFLPVMRSLSPLIWRVDLELGVLDRGLRSSSPVRARCPV